MGDGSRQGCPQPGLGATRGMAAGSQPRQGCARGLKPLCTLLGLRGSHGPQPALPEQDTSPGWLLTLASESARHPWIRLPGSSSGGTRARVWCRFQALEAPCTPHTDASWRSDQQKSDRFLEDGSRAARQQLELAPWAQTAERPRGQRRGPATWETCHSPATSSSSPFTSRLPPRTSLGPVCCCQPRTAASGEASSETSVLAACLRCLLVFFSPQKSLF